jgi:hypothetical protein
VLPNSLGIIDLTQFTPLTRPEGIRVYDSLLRAQNPALYNLTQTGHVAPKMTQLTK